jgi:DNA-binding NarL/FixJ family response regulator
MFTTNANSATTMPLLVLLVGNSPLMREAFKLNLDRISSDYVAVEAEDLNQAKFKLEKYSSVNLIIYHLHMIEDTIIYSLKDLKIKYSKAILIICSGLPSSAIKSFSLLVGAESYFQHTSSLESINFILGSFLNASFTSSPSIVNFTALSSRQIQILKLIDQGLSNDAIAKCLNIETTSIKTHLTRIYKRLEVKSRTHAVFTARKRGLL